MNLELYFCNMQVCLYKRVTFELFWITVSPKMIFDRSVTASRSIVTGFSGCCLGEVSSGGGITSRYPGASEKLWTDASQTEKNNKNSTKHICPARAALYWKWYEQAWDLFGAGVERAQGILSLFNKLWHKCTPTASKGLDAVSLSGLISHYSPIPEVPPVAPLSHGAIPTLLAWHIPYHHHPHLPSTTHLSFKIPPLPIIYSGEK